MPVLCKISEISGFLFQWCLPFVPIGKEVAKKVWKFNCITKRQDTHTKEVSTSFLQAHSHYDEEGEKWEKNEKVVNYLNLNCNRKTFLFVDQKWDLMCYILLVELARETGLLATGFKVKLFVSLINHYVPTTATFVNS